MAMAMKYVPSWRIGVIEERADVADSGDLAVYRCTANQEFTGDDGAAPMIEKTNLVSPRGIRGRQVDGTWRVAWSMVAPMEKPHKK